MGRILVAGDIHGVTSHAVTLLGIARKQECARVFVLGDFGAWEHMRDGRHYFDVVDRAARRQQLIVYFLDGNHDKSSLVRELYGEHLDDEGFLVCRKNIRYAPRGHRWTWDGTRFAAFGGAYSVDKPWRLAMEALRERKAERRRVFGSSRRPATTESLWFPEEQMTDEEFDALLAADESPVEVLLSHDKPRASAPALNRKTAPECLPNQDRIQRAVHTLRPQVLLHGHLHYRYTDVIDRGDGGLTRVEGLGADPDTAPQPGYDRADSWLVLPLPYQHDAVGEELASRAG
ncbi:metallophosphoesterase [Nocardia sp. NPDC052566]|uniref:metallophosphoesterase family protein n=1 Tax=Nocardia sp. NPDC052566 TaxID=3364330 RepID=UPI0037CBDAB2